MTGEIFSQEILWGVSIWRLITAVVVVFLGFASRRIIQFFFKVILRRKVEKSRMQWDNDVVAFLPAPLAVISQVLIWFGAVSLLSLPSKPINIQLHMYQGLEVALAAGFAWLVFRIIDIAAGGLARASAKTESKLDDQLIPLLRKTTKLVIALLVAVMVIQNLGYSVTSLIAGLGVGGLALALAAKDTIANVFGSVVVFTDRPFQIGDWIEFGNVEGTVEEVGFRTTQVRRFDKSLVTVPNQTFSSAPITNHSRRPIRRISMNLGLSYETSAQQMRVILDDLRELIKQHPGIDQSFNFVHFTEFGDSSLNLQIYCFTQSTVWTDFLQLREQLMIKVMELVESHGLEIAFPTRTVYLRDEHWQAASS